MHLVYMNLDISKPPSMEILLHSSGDIGQEKYLKRLYRKHVFLKSNLVSNTL